MGPVGSALHGTVRNGLGLCWAHNLACGLTRHEPYVPYVPDQHNPTLEDLGEPAMVPQLPEKNKGPRAISKASFLKNKFF